MNRPIILGPVPLLLGDSLVLPVNYSSKTSTGVLNPFDVFILIALFSHFEEDAQKKKLAKVQYSGLLTRESKQTH